MAGYIEREEMLARIEVKGNSLEASVNHYYRKALSDIYGTLVDIPTADVVEVRHGEWMKFDQECAVEFICSNCNFSIIEADPKQDCAFNYCPNCGAKMDGKDGVSDE